MTENIEKEDIQTKESSTSPVMYGADFWDEEDDEENEDNQAEETNELQKQNNDKNLMISSKKNEVEALLKEMDLKIQTGCFFNDSTALELITKQAESEIVDLDSETDIQDCYEHLIKIVEKANSPKVYIDLCMRGREIGNNYAKIVLLMTDNCTKEEKEKYIKEILDNRDEKTLLKLLKVLSSKDEELFIKTLYQIHNEHEAYSNEFIEFIKVYRLKAGLSIDNFDNFKVYENKEDECKLIANLFFNKNNSLINLRNYDFIQDQILKYKADGNYWTQFLMDSDNTSIEIKEKIALKLIASGEIMNLSLLSGKSILSLPTKKEIELFDEKESGLYELEKIYFDVSPYKKTYILKLEPYPETYKYVSKCFMSAHNEILSKKMLDFVAKCQTICCKYEDWLQNLVTNYNDNKTIVKYIYDLCVSDNSENVLDKINFIEIVKVFKKEELDIGKILKKYLELTNISELSIPMIEELVTVFEGYDTAKIENELNVKLELKKQEEKEKQRVLEEEHKKQLELEKLKRQQEAEAFANNIVQSIDNKATRQPNNTSKRTQAKDDTSINEWNDLQKLLSKNQEVKKDGQLVAREKQSFGENSLNNTINVIVYALFIVLFIVLLMGFILGGSDFLGVLLQTLFVGIIIYGVARIGLGKKKNK